MAEDQIVDDQIATELKEMILLLKETNVELKGIKDWITVIALLPFFGIFILIVLFWVGPP